MQNLIDMLKTAIIDTGGKGADDDVPAMLSEGEYVVPADIVALLGQGNNEAGGKILDNFLEMLKGMYNKGEGKD